MNNRYNQPQKCPHTEEAQQEIVKVQQVERKLTGWRRVKMNYTVKLRSKVRKHFYLDKMEMDTQKVPGTY
eukprot:12372930-Heterocapsa_arctica.AAC.1